jgi:hypothetical protein
MKRIFNLFSLAFIVAYSTGVNSATETNDNMSADAKNATKQVNEILVKCQEKLKLGKLQGYQKCALSDIQKLADQGNFAAQYQLAEWADLEGNHEEALQWFQKGNDNPSTPHAIKTSHQERLQELQQQEE